MELNTSAIFCSAILLVSLTGTYAQLTCFSCSGTYRDDTSTDDCFSPTAALTSTTTCGTGDKCAIGIGLQSDSISISRGCESTATDCNDCTDPENCRICCEANNCNSDVLISLLESKKLTQTCHKCRYSEIPGVHSDAGCGLTFDATSTAINTVHCHGMCYSSSSYIPGVEDITRGCAHWGTNCDSDAQTTDWGATQSDLPERNTIYFRRSCCMGDRCNSATAISAGAITALLCSLIGFFLGRRM